MPNFLGKHAPHSPGIFCASVCVHMYICPGFGCVLATTHWNIKKNVATRLSISMCRSHIVVKTLVIVV